MPKETTKTALNLNSKRKAKLIPHPLVSIIDSALIAENDKKAKRGYLGASYIGDPCCRKIQYQFFHTPKDIGDESTEGTVDAEYVKSWGRTLRIFDRGHLGEDLFLRWINKAGFTLGGSQTGFSVLDGLFSGHCDGIITDGHADLAPYPRLWECKVLGDATWKKLRQGDLKRDAPAYYGQMQIYMAYLELTDNPALFTALNANDMDILALDVPFCADDAQALSDKAVMILKMCRAGEQMSRLSDDPDFWMCRFCSYQRRCHAIEQ